MIEQSIYHVFLRTHCRVSQAPKQEGTALGALFMLAT